MVLTRHHSRFAQASHMFLYVLTLIIFVLILIFGYKMVQSFQQKSDELILLKFERDVQATLHSVTYGTTKIRTFEVPYGYREFWLVDREHAIRGNDLTTKCKDAPPEIIDILDPTKPSTKENAFLIGPAKFHAFTLTRISIADGCLSAPIISNELELRLSKG